jgi:hypothetical protein
MERAISYITVMPESKTQIQAFIDQVLSEVEIRQALPLLARLQAMEAIIKGIKDGLKDQMLEEADLEGEKSFTLNGVKYEKKSRATYYFHHCEKWSRLKDTLKGLEDMMKVAKEPFADPETGEVIEPARSSYSEYIAVTLPK